MQTIGVITLIRKVFLSSFLCHKGPIPYVPESPSFHPKWMRSAPAVHQSNTHILGFSARRRVTWQIPARATRRVWPLGMTQFGNCDYSCGWGSFRGLTAFLGNLFPRLKLGRRLCGLRFPQAPSLPPAEGHRPLTRYRVFIAYNSKIIVLLLHITLQSPIPNLCGLTHLASYSDCYLW